MAFTAGNSFVSYIQVGPKIVITFDHTGPAVYSPTTGDVINASDLGVGGFEFPDAGVDTTAKFSGQCVLPGAGFGASQSSFQLHWISLTTATVGGQAQTAGTDAVASTNLSTFSLRLQIFCV
jgi:hypothetical protein